MELDLTILVQPCIFGRDSEGGWGKRVERLGRVVIGLVQGRGGLRKVGAGAGGVPFHSRSAVSQSPFVVVVVVVAVVVVVVVVVVEVVVVVVVDVSPVAGSRPHRTEV